MNVEKLVWEYIKNNGKKGSTFKELYDKLLIEIKELDDQLKDLDKIRVQRLQKQKIAERINSMLQTNKITDSFDDDSDESKEITQKIVQIVAEKSPLSNRDIMLEFGSYNQDAKIIRCIKRLADVSVLDKDSDRNIVRGSNWNDRYKYVKEKSQANPSI